MSLSKAKIMDCLGKLTLLRYFPSNELALRELARIIDESCCTDRDADDVVQAMLCDYDEWPGPKTVRQICDEIFKIRHEVARTERPKRMDGRSELQPIEPDKISNSN